MNIKLIDIREPILKENQATAEQLAARFAEARVFVVNLMSSPGAGKTSLVVKTLEGLKHRMRIAVVEGDVVSTVDAERVASTGAQTVQINTHGACHIDAAMLGRAVQELDLEALDMLIVENVGNLVCPAEFVLGESMRAMILSVPEGHDKPLKYPLMFTETSALLINKLDLMPHTDFDLQACRDAVTSLNPDMRIFEISCRTGQGIDGWVDWLEQRAGGSQ